MSCFRLYVAPLVLPYHLRKRFITIVSVTPTVLLHVTCRLLCAVITFQKYCENQESYGFWLRDLYQSQKQGVPVSLPAFDDKRVLVRLKLELVACDTQELNVLRGAPRR